MSTDDRKRKTPQPSTISTTSSSNQSGSNDFVKKLFLMLEEDSYKDIVRWTHSGDSFVVLNTNEFTREILPRHFKHSNFASFVRQLNKYDFHKVKISNEERATYPYGDDTWEFKHPDFKMNDRESLDNIKRKGPSSKKMGGGSSSQMTVSGNGVDQASIVRCNHNYSQILNTQNQFKEQMEQLKQENKQLQQEINVLTRKYKTLVENIVAINTVDERNHRSMGILINCLMQAGIKIPPLDFPPPQNLQEDSSLPSLSSHILNQPQLGVPGATQRLPMNLGNNTVPMQLPQPQPNNPPYISSVATPTSQPIPSPGAIPMPGPMTQSVAQTPVAPPVAPPSQQPIPSTNTSTAPIPAPVPTSVPVPVPVPAPAPAIPLTRLTPSQDGSKSHSHTTSTSGSPGGQSGQPGVTSGISQTVPPPNLPLTVPGPNEVASTTTSVPNAKFHVLLVEDDNVCIQLCRKFLVKYGCQVTVVTDGLNAISTVEHTKYDLVLMDIVMPNLDGATATSVIRSFDTKTPIIAMTGNIEDNDLVTYLQNGMSDILAKPFTKDDLYSILAKHLLTDSNDKVKSEDESLVKKPRLI